MDLSVLHAVQVHDLLFWKIFCTRLFRLFGCCSMLLAIVWLIKLSSSSLMISSDTKWTKQPNIWSYSFLLVVLTSIMPTIQIFFKFISVFTFLAFLLSTTLFEDLRREERNGYDLLIWRCIQHINSIIHNFQDYCYILMLLMSYHQIDIIFGWLAVWKNFFNSMYLELRKS